MKMQKHWYLGVLGVVGFYMLPDVVAYFQGNGTIYALGNLLWFLWFAYLIPGQSSER